MNTNVRSATRGRSGRYRRGITSAVLALCLLSVCCAVILRFVDPPFTAVMLLEPGAFSAIDYRWVPRERISEHAARSVIAAEDQRFLEHFGFDLDQIDDAIGDWRRGGELRGASTITQQVAKNVFLWNGRSFVRKGLEAWLAIFVHVFVPKSRTLEIYLNVAEFGPGIFGIEAAARRFFGMSAADLSPAQAARLAAVLPGPKTMSAAQPGEYVLMRQQSILEQMNLLERRGHFRELDW